MKESSNSRLAPPSIIEGKVMVAWHTGGARFRVVNGQRVWIDTPPSDFIL